MRPRMLLARGEVRHCSTAAAVHIAKSTAAKKSARFEDICMLHLPPKHTPLLSTFALTHLAPCEEWREVFWRRI